MLLAINEVAGVERRDFKPVPMGNGIGGTSFYAISAENAAVVVNVVDLGIALGAADAMLFSVFCSFNVDAI